MASLGGRSRECCGDNHSLIVMEFMAQQPLVLASASPRRRELLSYLGITFRALSNDAEEDEIAPPTELAAHIPPADLPLHFHPTVRAWRKASAACSEAPDSVIIGADTIVVLDGDVLNKPADDDEARWMLGRLSGRTHTVYTGVAVIDTHNKRTLVAIEQSQVEIAAVSDLQIAEYVATGEPLDKAGAYGIQGLGGRLVRSVAGSYTNVVGLPLTVVYNLLADIGVGGLVLPADAYQHWLVAQGKEPLPCPPTSP